MRWFLVFWLFVLSAVSYLDRVNISIAGGSIAEAYQLSDVQLGKVFSAMLDLRRSWSGRWSHPPAHHVHDGPLWMALFVLGMRPYRICRRGDLVSRGSRHAGGASEDIRLRT